MSDLERATNGQLIREIERLRKENRLFDKDNARIIQSSKVAIDSLTKRRDEAIDKNLEWLKGWNEQRDQIAKLEAEIIELKGSTP